VPICPDIVDGRDFAVVGGERVVVERLEVEVHAQDGAERSLQILALGRFLPIADRHI
jgi:hypothetical protein